MQKDPLISVIVPMYNCGEYISDCLDSLRAQTHSGLEIIVIDDGSTDNGGKICREAARNDSRIIYIRRENGGVSAARNDALKLAKGEWIGFCDSDDRAEPDMFEYLLELAEKNGADISQCGTIMEFADSERITCCPENDTVIERFSETEKSVLKYYSSTVWCKLFKAETARGCRFDTKHPIGEDLLYGVETALHSKRIVLGSQPKYRYVQRADSACYAPPNAKSLVSARNALKRILELLPNESAAREFYSDEQLRNDFDICSKIARFSPENSDEIADEIRGELKSNLKYILSSADFTAKEKRKTRLIVGARRLYAALVRAKKREVPKN